MRVSGKNNRVCGSTYNGIDCFDLNNGTSFSINASDVWSVRAFSNNVCWIDNYGHGSCSGIRVPTRRTKDTVVQSDVVFSLFPLTLQEITNISETSRCVSQSVMTYPLLSEGCAATFSIGPFGYCVVFGDSTQCSSTLQIQPIESLSVDIGDFDINPPPVMHTSTIFDTNASEVNNWYGLPGCDGVIQVCASISSEVSITSGFSEMPYFKQLDLGYQRGYGVDSLSNLHCWGAAGTCPQFQNVKYVTAYNGGACVEFETSATCFGEFNHTFYFDSYSCKPNDSEFIFVEARKDYPNLRQCVACDLGSAFSYQTTDYAFECAPCSDSYYRGPGMRTCSLCPPNSVPNNDQSACVQCQPSQYTSDSKCFDCGLGSQSVANVCTSCPTPLVRDASMTSCSLCPIGSLPANGQTTCLSCPSPSIWVGDDYSTWTNGTCSDCPQGHYPTGFSCSLCVAPDIRTTESTCSSCPEGHEPNELRTVCFPCMGNTVRTGPTPFCFECPTGSASEDHARCIRDSKPFFTASQSALLSFGILILLCGITFRTNFSESQFVSILVMGLFFIAFSFVLPATKTK